jgi:hypothetical protein
MPLSTDEIAAAKKAYAEMRACDNAREMFIVLGIFFFPCALLIGLVLFGGIYVGDRGVSVHGWAAVPALFHMLQFPILTFSCAFLGQLLNYRRLKSRFAENLNAVQEIERRHADELPNGLEMEIMGKPRALLWRLDAFLSRKSVSS